MDNKSRRSFALGVSVTILGLMLTIFASGCATPAPHAASVRFITDNNDMLRDYFTRRGVAVKTSADGLLNEIENTPASRDAILRYVSFLRQWMDASVANMANVSTTRDAQGDPNPYRRQVIRLSDTGEFTLDHDSSPPRLVLDLKHPDARADGYVAMPDIDLHTEMTNAMTAAKDYELAQAILAKLDPHLALAWPTPIPFQKP